MSRGLLPMWEDSSTPPFSPWRSRFWRSLRSLPGLVDPIQLGWAVKKGKPNLVRAINETRAAMVADGTIERLFADIIGFDPSPKEPIRSML